MQDDLEEYKNEVRKFKEEDIEKQTTGSKDSKQHSGKETRNGQISKMIMEELI